MQVTVLVDTHGCHHRHVVLLGSLDRPFHLCDVLEILRNQEIYTAFLECTTLLVELFLHFLLGGATQERWRLANASCNKPTEFIRGLAREAAALFIDLCHAPLGCSLIATVGKLILTGIEREDLAHIAAGMTKLPV